MSQTFWEIDPVEGQSAAVDPHSDAQPDVQFDPQPELHAVAVEPHTAPEPMTQAEPEPEPLAVSADDFTALEERIVRAVELVKRERQLRAAAEQRAAKAEAEMAGQSPVVDQLRDEIRGLHAERDQVRQRVERLLAQLDALEI
jgi:hypothetical protein